VEEASKEVAKMFEETEFGYLICDPQGRPMAACPDMGRARFVKAALEITHEIAARQHVPLGVEGLTKVRAIIGRITMAGATFSLDEMDALIDFAQEADKALARGKESVAAAEALVAKAAESGDDLSGNAPSSQSVN
jgi:hypothetical protein